MIALFVNIGKREKQITLQQSHWNEVIGTKSLKRSYNNETIGEVATGGVL